MNEKRVSPGFTKIHHTSIWIEQKKMWLNQLFFKHLKKIERQTFSGPFYAFFKKVNMASSYNRVILYC